jgi:hypothetical protein
VVAHADDAGLEVGIEVEPGDDRAVINAALGEQGEGPRALVGAERLAPLGGKRDGDGLKRLVAEPGGDVGAALDPADRALVRRLAAKRRSKRHRRRDPAWLPPSWPLVASDGAPGSRRIIAQALIDSRSIPGIVRISSAGVEARRGAGGVLRPLAIWASGHWSSGVAALAYRAAAGARLKLAASSGPQLRGSGGEAA